MCIRCILYVLTTVLSVSNYNLYYQCFILNPHFAHMKLSSDHSPKIILLIFPSSMYCYKILASLKRPENRRLTLIPIKDSILAKQKQIRMNTQNVHHTKAHYLKMKT